ncbi:MAG: sulfite oxidase [Pseudomonadota bacterium]
MTETTPAEGSLPNHSRRRFIRDSATFAALLGTEIVFGRYLPSGVVPVALAGPAAPDPLSSLGKGDLHLLNDRPLNAETPAHLLDDRVTPAHRLFIRNNGIPPVKVDPDTWTLRIDGESAVKSTSYLLSELRSRFEQVDLQLTVECGGNGRAEFNPPASGNQWSLGAVGCPIWNGVRLRDVLNDVGIKPDAVYLGYYAADIHLSGDPGKEAISRGVPLSKALEAESMIAWGMNGEPLHPMHGFPLRLVFGGWPGSTSGKWLTRIAIRDRVHDGAKMTGSSYRMPRYPVAPGAAVADADMDIIEAMPIKSLITFPQSGVRHSLTDPLTIRGHAWHGDSSVARVATSIDFGQTWQDARLEVPVNRLAWQHWQTSVTFPTPGYYEVWARATDASGVSQPLVIPGWNPKGYLNNACHRVAVYVS